MATLYQDHSLEIPASSAQVRDLSAQVQAMQAQIRTLHGERPQRRFPLSTGLCLVAIVLLALALTASIVHPVRESTRTVMRLVPVVRVVHDTRVVVATPAPVVGGGVAVCTEEGFNLAAATCTQPVSMMTLTDLAGVRLSYSAKNGGAFTGTQVTIALSQQNASGSSSMFGRIPVEVGLTSTAQASSLQGVFDTLGVDPQVGGSYLVEVDQGTTNLGLARFTIVPDGQ